jgi:hypothetical protein
MDDRSNEYREIVLMGIHRNQTENPMVTGFPLNFGNYILLFFLSLSH